MNYTYIASDRNFIRHVLNKFLQANDVIKWIYSSLTSPAFLNQTVSAIITGMYGFFQSPFRSAITIPGGVSNLLHTRITKARGRQIRGRWSQAYSNPGTPKMKHIIYTHRRESHRGLTMSQIKTHPRPRGIPPNASRNDFRNDARRRYRDTRSVGWAWRAAGRATAWSSTSEPTRRWLSSQVDIRGYRASPRSTHFEHLTVAWLTSKSVDPRSEHLSQSSISSHASARRIENARTLDDYLSACAQHYQ